MNPQELIHVTRNKSQEVKLSNWGNSKAIRLTKAVLDEAGLNETDNIVFDVEVEPNKITLIRKSELTPFQKLFDSYNGGKPQPEMFWDDIEPVGIEI